MKLTTFALEEASRKIGPYQSPRTYLDFIVSGNSLKDLLRIADFVSPLCHEWEARGVHGRIDQLLLRRTSEIPNNRVPVYVCAECGDFGCGVVSADISRENDAIVWRDFGYENDYEEKVNRDLYLSVGPFGFLWSDYEAALTSAASHWR